MSEFEQLLAGIPPELRQRIFTEPMAWAEAFLVSPVSEAPFKANFVQRQVLGSPHRFNVLRVHRRAGKSYSMAILALFYALMYRSCQVLIIGPAGSHVNEIMTTIRDFLRVNPVWAAHVTRNKSSLPQRIEFDNGSRITGFTTAAKSRGKATGLRGQGADVILVDEAAFLAEDDWTAINPIMLGDSHRRWPPRVFVASTPAFSRGFYYEICTDPAKKVTPLGKTLWHEIHCSIEANPEKTADDVAEAKAMSASHLAYTMEYLAAFPDFGEGVFPKRMVDAAALPICYDEELRRAQGEGLLTERAPTRTIGVDWDKYNADGRGSTIVVIEAVAQGRMRLIYREEIPQSEFTLTQAVQRVISLNEIFRPEWIYVDRGFGDMQVEELQKHGKLQPHSGLARKVVGVAFAQNVEQALPGGGMEKVRFKQRMIQLLRAWFEQNKLEISTTDPVLVKELLGYHVTHQTESNLKFTSENDHAIAALGLAAMAMFQRIANPYAPRPATQSYLVQAPQPIAAERLGPRRPERDPERGTFLGGGYRDPLAPPEGLARGRLGGGPPIVRGSF